LKKIILILIITFISVVSYASNFEMGVLYVGQGLNVVVISPDKKAMVYDCGSTSAKDYNDNKFVFERVTLPYLRSRNVKDIDYLVLSHPHSDHFNAMGELIKNISVNNFLYNGRSSNIKDYQRLWDEIKNNNIKTQIVSAGMNFKLGSDVSCNILAPFPKISYDDVDSNSVVIKITYKKNSFLLMGDTADKADNLFISNYKKTLKSDVLVVAGHGTKYASTPEFLSLVNPDTSIISCGYNNEYYLPHKSTLDRLKRIESQIFRTDLQGDIIVSSDGKEVTVKTSY